jgi:glycosyltransferase involved in cell wall biosynthesis
MRLNRRGLRLASIVHEPEARDNQRSLMKAVDERMYRHVFAQFSALFVHNRANRDRLLELYPNLDRRRVHVIEHGNNLLLPAGGPADVDLRGRWGIPPEAPVVLFFGTMLPSKGITDLVQAFALTVARHPEARLVITGHASKKVDPQEYADLARTLGIAERVVVAPGYVPLDEVQPLMEMATVVAFPYRSATQSGAMQVAYAFGRPVVATRVGGLPEVVEEGRSGYTVPPQDPRALGEALNRLLDDPEAARRMGEHAAHLSRTKHSWAGVAAVLLGAFGALPAPPDAPERAPEAVGRA